MFKSPSSRRKVIDLLKALVNAGKTYRRHVVKLSQAFEHGKTDLLASHFRAERPGRLFDRRSQRLELLRLDRPVLAGRTGTGDHLAPVKGLTVGRPFDDPQHCLAHPFDGREPTPA